MDNKLKQKLAYLEFNQFTKDKLIKEDFDVKGKWNFTDITVNNQPIQNSAITTNIESDLIFDEQRNYKNYGRN